MVLKRHEPEIKWTVNKPASAYLAVDRVVRRSDNARVDFVAWLAIALPIPPKYYPPAALTDSPIPFIEIG
jgi:hypothetical protein